MATVIEKIRALPCVKNHDKSCELVPLLDQLERERKELVGFVQRILDCDSSAKLNKLQLDARKWLTIHEGE